MVWEGESEQEEASKPSSAVSGVGRQQYDHQQQTASLNSLTKSLEELRQQLADSSGIWT